MTDAKLKRGLFSHQCSYVELLQIFQELSVKLLPKPIIRTSSWTDVLIAAIAFDQLIARDITLFHPYKSFVDIPNIVNYEKLIWTISTHTDKPRDSIQFHDLLKTAPKTQSKITDLIHTIREKYLAEIDDITNELFEAQTLTDAEAEEAFQQLKELELKDPHYTSPYTSVEEMKSYMSMPVRDGEFNTKA